MGLLIPMGVWPRNSRVWPRGRTVKGTTWASVNTSRRLQDAGTLSGFAGPQQPSGEILCEPLHKTGGRNNQDITTRHRGGGPEVLPNRFPA